MRLAANVPVLPPAAADRLQQWWTCHERYAPDVVAEVFVVGSLALDDWFPHSDIDVVAVTVADSSDGAVAAQLAAAASTAIDLGVRIDGPYVSPVALQEPPRAIPCTWVLDGEVHTDDGCFELNPATWVTLAQCGVDAHHDPQALVGWSRANVESYWRPLIDDVARQLAGDERTDGFDPTLTEWLVLGTARMAYTTATGRVASKSAAGRWAAANVAGVSLAVDAACAARTGARDRNGTAVEGHDRRTVVDALAASATLCDDALAG